MPAGMAAVFPVKRKLLVVQGKVDVSRNVQPALKGRGGCGAFSRFRKNPLLSPCARLADSLIVVFGSGVLAPRRPALLACQADLCQTPRTGNAGAWLGPGLFRSLLGTRVVTRIGAHRCHRVGPVVEELAHGPQKSGRAKRLFEQGHVSAL